MMKRSSFEMRFPFPLQQEGRPRSFNRLMTANITQHSIVGITAYDTPFVLSDDARRRHLHIVGQTGSGKSTLILNLIAQDLAAHRGVALLDPHGELAEQALTLIPTDRAHQLVYLNPSDHERPIGFNVLEAVAPDYRATVADGVVSGFKHVWPEFWGPRLEYILLNATLALMDAQGSTLLGLPRLLVDEAYRAHILAHCRDPVVRGFWINEYNAYDRRFRNEAIAPIQNKIGRLLATPALRNMLAQPKSTINVRRMMDEQRILIVNLSKGALGESTAHLLGAFLTTAIAHAALSRADLPEAERQPFYLFADEFQTYASDSFALVLSEARKYALALTLGHQYLGQLPLQLRQAVLGNTGSVISFRVGAEDAPLLASHIGIENQSALKDLANFRAIGKFLTAGTPSEPKFLTMLAAPKAINHRPHKLIANSRIRFGRDRATIEAKVAKFLGAHAR